MWWTFLSHYDFTCYILNNVLYSIGEGSKWHACHELTLGLLGVDVNTVGVAVGGSAGLLLLSHNVALTPTK